MYTVFVHCACQRGRRVGRSWKLGDSEEFDASRERIAKRGLGRLRTKCKSKMFEDFRELCGRKLHFPPLKNVNWYLVAPGLSI